MGIAELVGPGLFTLTFAACIRPERGLNLPGAPFLLAAFILAIGALLASVTRSRNNAPT